MPLLFHFKYFSPGVRALLRVMADDFRCQVKQIISDFKAAERIVGDIPVGTEPVPLKFCILVPRLKTVNGSAPDIWKSGRKPINPFGKVEICLQIALEKWR